MPRLPACCRLIFHELKVMKHPHTRFILLCSGAIFLAFVAGARAQVQNAEAAIQQQQRIEQRQQLTKPLFRETLVPQLYAAESADVGPQYVVVPKVKRQWIELSLDSQFFYTSNVFLTEKSNVDSNLWVTTAVAAFAPTPVDV